MTLTSFGKAVLENMKQSSNKSLTWLDKYLTMKKRLNRTWNYSKRYPKYLKISGTKTIFIWFDSTLKMPMASIHGNTWRKHLALTSWKNMQSLKKANLLFHNWLLSWISLKIVTFSTNFKLIASLKSAKSTKKRHILKFYYLFTDKASKHSRSYNYLWSWF